MNNTVNARSEQRNLRDDTQTVVPMRIVSVCAYYPDWASTAARDLSYPACYRCKSSSECVFPLPCRGDRTRDEAGRSTIAMSFAGDEDLRGGEYETPT